MTGGWKMWFARLAFVAGMAAAPAVAEERLVAGYAKIPDGAIAVVAEIKAKPGKERELRQATLPLVNSVRAEPNNLVYFAHEDRSAPGRIVFYEIFATEADFEAHNRTPHVMAWLSKLADLADGEVRVTRMKILPGLAR